jgi:hypothetical protein
MSEVSLPKSLGLLNTYYGAKFCQTMEPSEAAMQALALNTSNLALVPELETLLRQSSAKHAQVLTPYVFTDEEKSHVRAEALTKPMDQFIDASWPLNRRFAYAQASIQAICNQFDTMGLFGQLSKVFFMEGYDVVEIPGFSPEEGLSKTYLPKYSPQETAKAYKKYLIMLEEMAKILGVGNVDRLGATITNPIYEGILGDRALVNGCGNDVELYMREVVLARYKIVQEEDVSFGFDKEIEGRPAALHEPENWKKREEMRLKKSSMRIFSRSTSRNICLSDDEDNSRFDVGNDMYERLEGDSKTENVEEVE